MLQFPRRVYYSPEDIVKYFQTNRQQRKKIFLMTTAFISKKCSKSGVVAASMEYWFYTKNKSHKENSYDFFSNLAQTERLLYIFQAVVTDSLHFAVSYDIFKLIQSCGENESKWPAKLVCLVSVGRLSTYLHIVGVPLDSLTALVGFE